jgi:CIC family chloride channel protein
LSAFAIASLLRWRPSPFTLSIILAVTVGLISGLAAVIFRKLIDFFHRLFFVDLQGLLSAIGNISVILLPAFGGMIVGLLVYFFAREAKGHGVPEVMLAVAKNGGRIRGRVSIVKALASSICIGSGGSVGREGPIVQVGAALASFLGQLVGISENWLRVLVACGAAGGISATFNAPIAGVFFALEVILGTFSVQNFGMVVLSSVIADVAGQTFLGNVPAFDVPAYALTSYWELGLYALLGLVSAFLGTAFLHLLYIIEDWFDEMRRVPEYIRPALGGLMLGVIGFFTPQIFGVGYAAISLALLGKYSFFLLVALALLKPLATSLTLGSGGSGGVFAPSLFIGAMGGTALGMIFHSVVPEIAGPAGGYGLVGMAAVFASAAWAPITAILIIFELTRDYSIMLPLMLATVISTGVSHLLTRENIYTLKLARRGINLHQFRRSDPADSLPIREVMTQNYPTVSSDCSVEDLSAAFERTGVHGFPVLDADDNLIGIVTAGDVERALLDGSDGLTAQEIASRSLLVAHPEQTLGELVGRIGAEVGYIPVVDRDHPKRLLGMLRRHDIIGAYARAQRR